MIEAVTLLLLFGALLYRTGIGLAGILMISALTSVFFFTYFLSRRALWYGLLLGALIVMGALNVGVHVVNTDPSFFANRTIRASVQSVDRRLDKTNIVIRDLTYKKLLQVTIHSQQSIAPGDEVMVRGAINRPEDFLTDTGRLFPYQHYLLSKNIVGIVPLASVTIVSSGTFSLTRLATTMRFHIADTFSEYVSFPIDGLLSGMLVGYQGGVPSAIQDLFRTTGVLHVLVLSGENITLLAVFLGIVLRPLPFRTRTVLTGCAIVLVVLISGSGVAAVRAGIMGIIALSAGMVRRTYLPFRALTISVIFFFLYSPEIIFSDPGFHLSVLATLFMVLVVPKIETLFSWLPQKYAVRELCMLAVCVPLFMLPYTMYFSGLVPLSSPFANILMAIMTPVFMLCGAAVLGISWLIPVAQVLGTIVSLVGKITIALLQLLNKLPQLNAPPLAWWGVLLSYFLFFGIVFRRELMQSWYSVQSAVLPRTSSSVRENH